MSSTNLTRRHFISLTMALWMVGVAALLASGLIATCGGPTVKVVHWTNGHLLRTGTGLHLLTQMAKEFNDAGHHTKDGKRIVVEVDYVSGATLTDDLTSRIAQGGRKNSKLPDPTLVTPSASHWLANVNYAAGRQVVDLSDIRNRSIARTYVGIVTFREMAECLGWPQKAIGYADIIALRNDPLGWARHPCAKAEWGQKPLVAFTDPSATPSAPGTDSTRGSPRKRSMRSAPIRR